jgi:hypothetical protein
LEPRRAAPGVNPYQAQPQPAKASFPLYLTHAQVANTHEKKQHFSSPTAATESASFTKHEFG